MYKRATILSEFSILILGSQFTKNKEFSVDSRKFFVKILLILLESVFRFWVNLGCKFCTKHKRFRHNLEKYCLIKYLNKFFEKLKKNNIYNNLEIILFSDHDSRISNDSNNNVIFAHKKSNSAGSKIITEKISINEILHNLINNVN